MANKIYEYEMQRAYVTPNQFFTYCKKQLENKGFDIENWIEYESWINPQSSCNNTWDHRNEENPYIEICKMQPYDHHLFLSNAYNFIMEFEYDTDSKGHGYLYIVEFER